MAKISVIIPIYNVEQYLEKCLESIINQTFKDLEIICINDGSTDNCPKILEKYAQKDNRIKVINKENGGLSSARNIGIEVATGDYIGFIDSDDWIAENYYEKLYNSIVKYDADIACTNMLRYGKFIKKYRFKYVQEECISDIEKIFKICKVPVNTYVMNKLYKSELVKNFEFKYGVYYEDLLWTPQILLNTKKLAIIPDTVYYYRSNSKSIVKTKPSAKKIKDMYENQKWIVEFLDKNNLPISEKERCITKNKKFIGNFCWLKIKEYRNTLKYLFLGFIPIFKKKIAEEISND